MRTLSQMVDEIAAETRRPDLTLDIARFVNQTIRELHSSGDRRAAQFFRSNFQELELTTVVESGYVWPIPNSAIFQAFSVAKYPSVFDAEGKPVWAKEVRPGRRQNDFEAYWYRAGESIAFSGFGAGGNKIQIGYFEFPVSLKLYADESLRPAQYDEETGWTYHAEFDTTDELRETARNRVTNWMLLRWADVVAEGVRAKLFKRVGDVDRGKLSYSMYENLRQGLWTSETVEFFA